MPAIWSCTTSAAVALTLLAAAAIAAPPPPPGVVVHYTPPPSKVFVGSPGIARLRDGTLLAKCDDFGPASGDHTAGVTRVFRSADRGVTWTPAAKLSGVYWANVFEHRDAVYMVGTHHEYGQLVVVKSSDGGTTWTTPTDARTGLIRPGKWHTAPVPMVEHAGRLWRGVEDAEGPGGWGLNFHPHLMSILVDGDLLDANQWTVSDPVPRDGKWLGGPFAAMLEGNAVFDRAAGKVRDVLRTDKQELAAVATADESGRRLSVDPAFDRMPFQGVDKKFEIRWDQTAQMYFALANPAVTSSAKTGDCRNTLALYGSVDLRTWSMRCVLLHHPDAAHHAFQYADWTTDGDDLLVASRTAWDGPDGLPGRGHDADYLTFHRFARFRTLTMADGVQVPQLAVVTHDVGGLRITGRGFTLSRLDNGQPAFANRPYVWADVPPSLRGATVTHGDGDFHGTITVEATGGPTELTVFTAGPTTGVDLTGFTPVPSLKFCYTDGGRSAAAVYRRPLAAGQRVTLPTGNWAGVHVLVPAAGSKAR